MNIFEELEARDLIKQITNKEKIRSSLNDGKFTFYIGFDPTAESLHVGHLLQIVLARRLVMAGNTAIMLIGSATAMIGDPTGKSDMRKMLSLSEVRSQSAAIDSQIYKLMQVPFYSINNMVWFHGMNFLKILREIGPHFSVNNMLRADCFKSRMENGLSFMEFNYMLMQATDFLNLFDMEGCRLQIGGDDQWSNILAGIDLIHKIRGQEVFGMTLPLLTTSAGQKMGKTERGTVWLDPNKTSPFEFFQFWRNIEDSKVKECINFFTDKLISKCSEINEYFNHINEAKKFLAFEITKLVHGQEEADKALQQAKALFEQKDTSVVEIVSVDEGIELLNLLVTIGFAKSRNDARKLIANRGITINEQVVEDPLIKVNIDQFGVEFILKKGKKNFARFIIKS